MKQAIDNEGIAAFCDWASCDWDSKQYMTRVVASRLQNKESGRTSRKVCGTPVVVTRAMMAARAKTSTSAEAAQQQ